MGLFNEQLLAGNCVNCAGAMWRPYGDGPPSTPGTPRAPWAPVQGPKLCYLCATNTRRAIQIEESWVNALPLSNATRNLTLLWRAFVPRRHWVVALHAPKGLTRGLRPPWRDNCLHCPNPTRARRQATRYWRSPLRASPCITHAVHPSHAELHQFLKQPATYQDDFGSPGLPGAPRGLSKF